MLNLLIRGDLKMPTYEYKCNKCEEVFEVFQRITENPLRVCSVCGGELKRLISGGAGIIFKGSGFYITDYKNSSNTKGSLSTASDKKESKKESKNTEPVSSENIKEK
jgi:putative FmdB family regulatory protein